MSSCGGRAEGYNLADTRRGDGQDCDDRAEEIELEIRDRRNTNSKEEDHERSLDALAAQLMVVMYEKGRACCKSQMCKNGAVRFCNVRWNLRST